MKRQVPGLAATVEESRPSVADGIYLVRLDQCPGPLACAETVPCALT